VIDEALRQLPHHQRIVLVLYHFEDIPYEEIAARCISRYPRSKPISGRARAALLPLLRAKASSHD